MKFHLVLFVFCFLTSTTYSQDIDFDAIDQYLQETQSDWDVVGFSVGIVKDGELIFSKGYGELAYGRGQTPNGQSNYAIASNTKAFTCTMMAMLVEEGLINWDDKVVDHLPYFELSETMITQMVTIEDLLTHRVGLGTFHGDVMWYDSNLTAEEIVRRLKHLPFEYSFRDGYGYSNVMYVTAGDLIEKVTGKSWSQNVKERILDPLGLSRTVSELSVLKTMGNVAQPHATHEGKNKDIRWEDWAGVVATGGIYSNVEDLANWLTFTMSDGIYKGDTLLTSASRDRIWSVHNPYASRDQITDDEMIADFSGYGLGFRLSEYKNHFHVSHTGGYGGMLSAIDMLPNENLAVIFLSNDTKSPMRAVTHYILDRYVDAENETNYSQANLINYNNFIAGYEGSIEEIREKRVKNTLPSRPLENYESTFYSDLYGGHINVVEEKDGLHLYFEHQPNLSATLTHWHHDTFEIHWDQLQPWFDFGLVQFDMDTNQEITGLSFNIPNYDFFFNELAPYVKE